MAEPQSLFPQPIVKPARVLAPSGAVLRMEASVFFGRGIHIEVLPQRIPDALFVHGGAAPGVPVGGPVSGLYNRGGTLIPIHNAQEARVARTEIGGWPAPTAYNAHCRISNSRVVANLPRAIDVQGQMLMTGFVHLSRAKSDQDVAVAVSTLNSAFRSAGLFGPLTPVELIPRAGRADPRAYDYYANDPAVWAPGFRPE